MVTARFPVYIPSKNRADIATTPRNLDRMGVPYRLVVEEDQFDAYAARYGAERVLVLPPEYLRDYKTCDEGRPDSLGKGTGPPRNFAWDHAISEGHAWHWEMDDNIMAFYFNQANRAIVAGDGSFFHAMEEFCTRYRNISMGGPEYKMFVPARQKRHPFTINRKIYSCLLIRNAVPLRWECRYNEDIDIGLRMMKSGWATITFLAFTQDKITTHVMPGGNTDAFYATEGTLEKSKMLVRQHPDVAKLARRFGRAHHIVDYKPFADVQLLPDPDWRPSGVSYQYRETDQTETLYKNIQRDRTRARQDIQRGFHPLLTLTKGRNPAAELHPDADRSGERGKPTEPLRCGSCRFRLQHVHSKHTFTYQCGFGQLEDGTYPLATGRHDAEIRLWWPACKNYEQGSTPLNGLARDRR